MWRIKKALKNRKVLFIASCALGFMIYKFCPIQADRGLSAFISSVIFITAVKAMQAIQTNKWYIQKRRYYHADIYTIDHLSGFDFERYLAAHFYKLGYKVMVTPEKADYGVDIVLIKGTDRIAIQAKRYQHDVSYKAIQEVVAGKAVYACNKAMVITNSYFTDAGKALAKKNNVELWDRDKLISIFNIATVPDFRRYAYRKSTYDGYMKKA